jgi:hypothetical protein
VAPFELDEYASASYGFLVEAVDAVARAGNGLVAQVTVEQVEALIPTQNTLDSGDVVQSPPMVGQSLVTMTISEGIAGRFDDVHVAIAQLAEDREAQLVPQMVGHISKITEATGNVIDMKGRDIWEAQLEAIETIHISFDADGDPSLPQLLMHPDTAAKIGEPPAGFQERFNEIVERRHDEWMASRRTRRLPSERL